MTNRELANARLKRLRYAKGYSLQELANATGLSKSHCWEMERSLVTLRSASYHNIEIIAFELGTTVAKLMAH